MQSVSQNCPSRSNAYFIEEQFSLSNFNFKEIGK